MEVVDRQWLCGHGGREPQAGVYRYETKAGQRWRVVYDGPPTLDPENGQVRRRQRQQRGFVREKDAKRALRDLLGAVDAGTYVAPDQITLGTYITDEWLPSIEPRSAESGRSHRGTVCRDARPVRRGPAPLRPAAARRREAPGDHPC